MWVTKDNEEGRKKNKFPRSTSRDYAVFTGVGGGSAANTSEENERKLRNRIALGAFLRDLREDQGMTQTDIGDAIGVSFSKVSSWERGASRINETHVPAYAKALGVPEETIARAILRVINPYLYSSIYGTDDAELKGLVGHHIVAKGGAKKPPRK